jgi:hypothetical protein
VDATARRRSPRLSVVAGLAACLPLAAACAVGFGAPTRHAVANFQAANVNVDPSLAVRDLVVALPSGTSSAAGGVAYLQFAAVSQAGNADQLLHATASIGGKSLSAQPFAVGDVSVPPRTATAPGYSRITVAFDPLSEPLHEGDVVHVSLQFANAGSVDDVPVPVWGADFMGTFLPSSTPSLPSAPSSASAPASASASSPASAPASAAASGSVPVGSAGSSATP